MTENEIYQLHYRILIGPFREAQELIDNGNAWRFEGSVGRACKAALESGACMLGDRPQTDAYGHRVPARGEVEPGTEGSPEYCNERYAAQCGMI